MVSRLMDLVVLVAELSQRSGKAFTELDDELALRGYSAEEIDQAFFWISTQDRPFGGESFQKRGRACHRVLSPWESMCLDADSYGYLLRLQNLGIIDIDEVEKIITRILPFGGEKMPLSEFKTLVGSVVFDMGYEDTDDEQLDALDENNQLT
ncbi:MAG: DUF494 family protein [Candidatus Latescibacterota bacterium]|nr:MAG: DUF494 family protein [Candidatus Latescibacterota bacterium]